MNFRQRLAWLMVLIYLGGTFAFFYYVFEINDHFNVLALDHIQKFHPPPPSVKENVEPATNHSIVSTLWGHVTDLPLSFWMLVFLLPYLQIFLMILACTRLDPRQSMAYMWPGLIYLKYQKLFRGHSSLGTRVSMEPRTLVTANGYNVIHT